MCVEEDAADANAFAVECVGMVCEKHIDTSPLYLWPLFGNILLECNKDACSRS